MRPRKRFICVKETLQRPTKETYKRDLRKKPAKETQICEKDPQKRPINVKATFTTDSKMWKRPTKENYKCERKRHQKRITYVKETYKSDPNTWKRPTRETYKCERDLKGDSYM